MDWAQRPVSVDKHMQESTFGDCPPRRACAGELILLVESEPLIAIDLEACLKSAGADVFHAPTLSEALAFTRKRSAAAAVIEYYLPGQDAEALCSRLERRSTPFVFLSKDGADQISRWARVPVIHKPVHPDVVVDAVVRLLRNARDG